MVSVRPVLSSFLVWLVLLPLFFIEKGAFLDFLDERRLHTPGEFLTTTGEITETRNGQDGSVQVRYKFSVNGETYTASDEATKRRNLWIAITIDAWANAQNNFYKIEVKYLPDNPWANEPVDRVGTPVADTFAGWLLFFVIDAWSIYEFFLIFLNYVKCREAAELNQPLRLKYWEAKEI